MNAANTDIPHLVATQTSDCSGRNNQRECQALIHNCDDLITVFNRIFSDQFNTRLMRGDNEPIYLPADAQCTYNRVMFAHGFFSSALHEVAHWCIAGEHRRQQIDYGYWYAPDGRSASQQAEFERVEVKPQALEWIFSRACNKSFRISSDNLNGEQTDASAFRQAVHQQVVCYCQQGLPVRAQLFYQALCRFYFVSARLQPQLFVPVEC